jgi:hypothetical protein
MTTTLEVLKEKAHAAVDEYGSCVYQSAANRGKGGPGLDANMRGACLALKRAIDAIAALQAEQGQEPVGWISAADMAWIERYREQCGAAPFHLMFKGGGKRVALYNTPQPTPPAEQWVSVKERLPEIGREMFVVRGFDVIPCEGCQPYTTDAYAVWMEGDTFVRWPHKFPPTHWMLLPGQPVDSTNAGGKS